MQIDTRLSPSVLFFVGARGEPGYEAKKTLQLHVVVAFVDSNCSSEAIHCVSMVMVATL